jgi:transcriptional regulator with XRE-family HTH domain
MADLIETFKTLRKQKGLSQKDVSDNTGVALITVYTWESKQRQPTLENFNKVLEKMGYELSIQPLSSVEQDVQRG